MVFFSYIASAAIVAKLWQSWGAAFEISAITTVLSLVWWLWPILHYKKRSLLAIGAGIVTVTAASLFGYTYAIVRLGPDGPLLTMWGFAARVIFAEDAWVIFAWWVVPVTAVLSGTILSGASCCLIVGSLRRLMRS